jgi:hypothetical protein
VPWWSLRFPLTGYPGSRPTNSRNSISPQGLRPQHQRFMEALKNLEVGEQIEIAFSVVETIFINARTQAEKSQLDSEIYSQLFEVAEDWLRLKFSKLRLPSQQIHQPRGCKKPS